MAKKKNSAETGEKKLDKNSSQNDIQSRVDIATLTHIEDKRKNIPTAEHQSVLAKEDLSPIQVAYERRNRDLDPQLVWRGKDQQDWSDLVVNAPPLYIQEKIHPKVLIDDLARQTKESEIHDTQLSLFDDFNGIPKGVDKTEFYQHDQNWTNRMILGDSLQVMASLAEREGLRSKVQCLYIDPPYGIKFNSNFQWSTTSRDVKDGKADHITREPEQVRAFRDTWRDGIHSYLTYLRDRLTVARDLLTDSGSIFVQIGDENVHRVRAVMDEVFGEDNYQNTIYFQTTGGLATSGLTRIGDFVLWYSKNSMLRKRRSLFVKKAGADDEGSAYKNIEIEIGLRRRLTSAELDQVPASLPKGRIFRISDLCGQGATSQKTPFTFNGREYHPTKSSHWKPNYPAGMIRASRAGRIYGTSNTLNYVRFFDDYPVSPLTDVWQDTGHSGFSYDKLYVVQTATTVIERCILMSTDPGDLA
jgi:adenine-specific DNA-methyltransferase